MAALRGRLSRLIRHLTRRSVSTKTIRLMSSAFLSTLHSSDVVNTLVENHERTMFDNIKGPEAVLAGNFVNTKDFMRASPSETVLQIDVSARALRPFIEAGQLRLRHG